MAPKWWSNLMAEQVKIRFELDSSDWHGHGSEALWAAPIARTEWRHFRIMNSPFFARGISHLDIVEAASTGDGLIFEFRKVIERGGHSTYMLIVQVNEHKVRAYWTILEKMGCSYESAHINLSTGRRLLFSVDVPPSANLYEVYEVLERGEADSVWIFQEGYANLSSSPAI
jgi:hypothetical protein